MTWQRKHDAPALRGRRARYYNPAQCSGRVLRWLNEDARFLERTPWGTPVIAGVIMWIVAAVAWLTDRPRSIG